MSPYKSPKPPGFFDAEMRLEQIRELEDPILRLHAAIDWDLFRPALTELTRKAPKGPGGQKPFDPLMMFKALILGRLHNLSDHGLERQIRKDLTFMAFLGLTLADRTPDEKTFWDFREKIGGADGFTRLFERFNEHLRAQGCFTKEGRIVDATFVEVPIQRNTRRENQSIKDGNIPGTWDSEPSVLSQKDVDARWTKKNNVSYYGYKNHVKVDAGSKLVESFTVTPAHVHDSQPLDSLVEETDGALWADSAYSGQPCEEALEAKNVENQICEKGRRNAPLRPEQKAANRQKSKVRARVEHVFAFMTSSMNGLFQRAIGLTRNAWGIALTNLVYNLCRYEQILRLKILAGKDSTNAFPA